MLDVPASTQEPNFFPGRSQKDERPTGPWTLGKYPCDLQHSSDTGAVVIGAVIDGVSGHWRADAEVIVMGVDKNSLGTQAAVRAWQSGDDVIRWNCRNLGICSSPETKLSPTRSSCARERVGY
jgi:hypothetical protein